MAEFRWDVLGLDAHRNAEINMPGHIDRNTAINVDRKSRLVADTGLHYATLKTTSGTIIVCSTTESKCLAMMATQINNMRVANGPDKPSEQVVNRDLSPHDLS